MSNEMVVIPLESPLNLYTVRKATAWLNDQGVMTFNDGMYHATISQRDAIALLGGFSEHDAQAAGFEIVNENPIRFIFSRIRWEISDESGNVVKGAIPVSIFGPKSDPAAARVFEQERQATDGVDNSRPEKS